MAGQQGVTEPPAAEHCAGALSILTFLDIAR
jgi:hypothetical protein